MKRCNIDCEFLSQFDLFGKEPELYFKGKSQRTSVFGKVLTYFYIAIYAGFFAYKIVRMLEKVDISFYETYAFSGTPSIKLTNDLFYGGFSLGNIIDDTLYYPVVYYYEGHRVNGKMDWNDGTILELEVCQLNKFGERYRDIFKDKHLNNLYCLKDVSKVTLEGYSHLDSYKYLLVYFMPCIDYNPFNGKTCKDRSDLEQFFAINKITFNIQDIELTPHIYDTPSQPLEKDISGPAFKTLYQQIYTYLQIVNLETDQDLIGFEGLSDIETQQFLKYDESWIISAPSPHANGFVAGKPICEVTIQLSAKVLTQIRKNTKLIEALGDVGGLMEVVWSLFNIISSVITDLLYDKALVNNLFSFDLDKKIVEIKKKKENSNNSNTLKLDESPQIYSPMKNIKNKINSNIIQDELSAQSRNKLNDDIFTKEKSLTLKRKKKKKKKIKNLIGSPTEQNIISNKNTVEEDNLKGINSNNNIYNKNQIGNSGNEKMVPLEIKMVEKETERGGENRRIIDRIKMKCCCVYFWFCFARKKKNIQNILLDEGMRVIVEKLDIINIFKKIYSTEFIEKSLKIKGNVFEMSDTCKQKMKLYIK